MFHLLHNTSISVPGPCLISLEHIGTDVSLVIDSYQRECHLLPKSESTVYTSPTYYLCKNINSATSSEMHSVTTGVRIEIKQ